MYPTAAAGILIMLLLGYTAVWSLFAKELVHTEGWSNTAASMPTTIYAAMYATGGFVSGLLQRRFAPHKVALISGLTILAGQLIAWSCFSYWGLVLGYGLIGGFGLGSLYTCALSIPIKYSSEKNASRINGAIMAAFGLAAVFYSPLITWVIRKGGTRSGFLLLAVTAGILPTLISLVFQMPGRSSREITSEKSSSDTITLRDVFKNPLIYIFCLWYFAQGVVCYSFSGHLANIAYAQASITDAAILISVYAACNCASRLISGFLDTKKLVYTTLIVTLANVLLLNSYHSFSMLFVSCIIMGGCCGVLAASAPILIRKVLGSEVFSVCFGTILLFAGFGSSLGPVITGRCMDMTGSYYLSYLFSAFLLILTLLTAVQVFALLKKSEN